jgi:hypothetical protein
MYLRKTNEWYQPPWIFKRLFNLLKACNKYHSPLTFGYYQFFIACLRGYFKEGFTPEEVFRLGAGSFFLANEKMKLYVSRSKMDQIDNILNPLSWKYIVKNKAFFHLTCENLNLPVPKLYAILFKNYVGFSYINSSLIEKEELIKFIKNELPNNFVIKPNEGHQGKSINIYTKTNRGIMDGFGNIKTEQEIYETIASNEKWDSFIVEERLRNHPYLLKIHSSENLHTIRIITFIDLAGQCQILHGHLNIATGQEQASQKGSIKVNINLNDGCLEFGILLDKNKGGFKKVVKHPESHLNFQEFKLPFWKDILLITEKAALKFLPLRTLGWDFAITEKCVKLLEANTRYTVPNYFRAMDQFIKILTDDHFIKIK